MDTRLVFLLTIIVGMLLAIWHRTAPYSSVATPGTTHALFTDSKTSTLLLDTRIRTLRTIFLIDTGYAGPCVLNTHFMARKTVDEDEDVVQALDGVRGKRLATQEYAALQQFMALTASSDFTSGCRMQLTGISTSTHKHSDLVLTHPLSFRTTEGDYSCPKSALPAADILVTNSVVDTPHILTMDYIRHHAPCMIETQRKRVTWCMSTFAFAAAVSFTHVSRHLSGGVFLIPVNIGGVVAKCVLDTGSEMCVTLSPHVGHAIRCTGAWKSISQSGIQEQRACSAVVEAAVEVAGSVFEPCLVGINTIESHVDGFVGMGLLRCFDLLITRNDVWLRRNAGKCMTLRDSDDHRCTTTPPACTRVNAA